MKRLIRALLLTTLGFSLLAGPAAGEVKRVKGQTLYLPSYSSFIKNGHSYDIQPTIFIHNVDQHNPINIVRLDLFDSNGKLVEKDVQQPVKLNANAAIRFNMNDNLQGEEGAEAHVIIQWQAPHKVIEPLVEAWFLGAAGTRGYTFTSQAKVIHEEGN
jgi:hypothetical protein